MNKEDIIIVKLSKHYGFDSIFSKAWEQFEERYPGTGYLASGLKLISFKVNKDNSAIFTFGIDWNGYEQDY